MLSEFILAGTVRKGVTERIWHPFYSGLLIGSVLVRRGEDLAVMSYVLCLVLCAGGVYMRCERSTALSIVFQGGTGESRLLIVSLKPGYIQDTEEEEVEVGSEMAITQRCCDTMNIYNQSG